MDLQFERGRPGSAVVGITACSPAGLQWLQDHLHTASWQWEGETVRVDHRYAPDIWDGAQADGLAVEVI
jgi:hypothetical protein